MSSSSNLFPYLISEVHYQSALYQAIMEQVQRDAAINEKRWKIEIFAKTVSHGSRCGSRSPSASSIVVLFALGMSFNCYLTVVSIVFC